MQYLSEAGIESAALEATGHSQSEAQWDEIMADLFAIGNRLDNWDDEGAKAPSAALWQSAVELGKTLRSLGQDPPSSVYAGPNGTVLFDWQNDFDYFDIEVVEPFRARWMRVIPGQEAKHGALQIGRPQANSSKAWVADSWIDAQLTTLRPILSSV
jgi:hypothetical protein